MKTLLFALLIVSIFVAPTAVVGGTKVGSGKITTRVRVGICSEGSTKTSRVVGEACYDNGDGTQSCCDSGATEKYICSEGEWVFVEAVCPEGFTTEAISYN